MAAVIAILTSVAVLIYWLSRAASNAHHVTDAANELANLPRKRRFMKAAGKRGLDLIEDPREAATVLMVATARLSKDGRVNIQERMKMRDFLISHMEFEPNQAFDFIDNVRWLTRDYKQADSVLRPMVNVLRGTVNAAEAQDLVTMLTEIASSESEPNADQLTFINKYKEYMGLNA